MTTTNLIILCIIITLSIVYVYDFVGFPRQFIQRMYYIFTRKDISLDRIVLPKLLECSLCATQWLILIVLIIFNWHLAPLSFVLSWSTKPFLKIMIIVDNFIDKILNYVLELSQSNSRNI